MLLFLLKRMIFPVTVLLLLVAAAPPSLAQTPNKDLVRAESALSAVQKRVALVIGNKDYAAAQLTNPVNDATAMAFELKELGFDVLLKTNLTNRQMIEAVDDFAGKLDKNTIGLFYFSGHGIQVDGANYLVPIGYTIKRQADVAFEAFPAQRLLDTMGGSSCRCNIVILDACRNNPLPKSLKGAGDDGLGKMNAPSGTFIAYATAPGQTASDDPDKTNGLYTGVLLQKMKQPGLKIEDVFKATLVSVAEASGEKQVPWTESSLRNDFYFAAGIPQPAPVPVLVTPPVVVEKATKGGVRFASPTPGVTFTVGGRKFQAGEEYTETLLDTEKKKVEVRVTAEGHEPKILDVEIERGKTPPLLVTLTPIVAPTTPASSSSSGAVVTPVTGPVTTPSEGFARQIPPLLAEAKHDALRDTSAFNRIAKLSQIAVTECLMGNTAAAEQTLRSAIPLVSEAGKDYESGAWQKIGVAQAALGQIAEVNQTLPKITSDYEVPEVFIAGAEAQMRRGDKVAARQNLGNAVKATEAVRYLDYVQAESFAKIAALLVQLGDTEAARRTLLKAQTSLKTVDDKNNRGTPLQEIVGAQAALGDIAAAKQSLIGLSGPDTEIAGHYAGVALARIGRAQARGGDVAGARTSLLEAQKRAETLQKYSVLHAMVAAEIAPLQAQLGDKAGAEATLAQSAQFCKYEPHDFTLLIQAYVKLQQNN